MDVVELRRYRLVPGRRDELIALFDAQLRAPQDRLGLHVLGTFCDLDEPDHFVWLRGFSDMTARTAALEAFYLGDVWRAHRDAANATMLDSDDVLLLTPAQRGATVPPARPPGAAVLAAIVRSFDAPATDAQIDAVAAEQGVGREALLVTLDEPNGFPALPVREGEHVVVALRWHTDAADAQRARLVPTGG